MKDLTFFILLSFFPFLLVGQLPQQIDLRPYTPFAGQQGNFQSCTGWAVGYGAMTIEMAVKNNWTDRRLISQKAFSPAFIYHQIHRGNCQGGAPLLAALNLVLQRGNVNFNTFDRQLKSCQQQPNSIHLKLAQKQKIKGFNILFSKQKRTTNKVALVKQFLAKRKPVIIGLQVTEGFYHLKTGAKYWWIKQGNQTPAGAHALVVVAYNDQKQAFCLLNSQGTQWGDNGFIWIKYDYFQQLCQEAYVIY